MSIPYQVVCAGEIVYEWPYQIKEAELALVKDTTCKWPHNGKVTDRYFSLNYNDVSIGMMMIFLLEL